MRIGIAFDLRGDFPIDGGRPDDWLEEYDSEGYPGPSRRN